MHIPNISDYKIIMCELTDSWSIPLTLFVVKNYTSYWFEDIGGGGQCRFKILYQSDNILQCILVAGVAKIKRVVGIN